VPNEAVGHGAHGAEIAFEIDRAMEQTAEALREQFQESRQETERICAQLLVEDHCVQSSPDVSPPKWHLAHTSWFFENFLLIPKLRGYRAFHPAYSYLFNSYYESVGSRIAKSDRGLLSRPSLEEIHRYRYWVDRHLSEIDWQDEQTRRILELGIHHEQQHQELLLMDIKHIFFSNPLRPAYQERPELEKMPVEANSGWAWVESGMGELGFSASGFAFDNERPRHRVYLHGARLRNRVVSCGEYLEFIEAGGYREPRYWLSEGWARVRERGWQAPLYWERQGSRWEVFTLAGMRPIEELVPVAHLSFYEADAYARWKGCELPGEEQWEAAVERGMPYGSLWEWTRSPYLPYPGFRPFQGDFSEYNGKFMSNQMVMRGKSCGTPETHLGEPARPTYRNFYPPDSRWQFGGFRIATSGS
jgi:ergothioneine biosynthesis protein EgtB